MFPYWYWYPHRRYRRRSDWFDKLSLPRQSACLLAALLGFPFAVAFFVLALFFFISHLAFEPSFWLLLFVYITWAAFQK